MKSLWIKNKIENHFPEVHHFISNKFKSNRMGLKSYYNWCKERDIQAENQQTLQRALEVVRLFEDGMPLEEAIKEAWKKFPILMR